ncbi:MAG TPA: hypothetical protein VF426_12680 [Marmoricola sp.]
MGYAKKAGTKVGRTLAPKVTRLAPDATATFIHQVLDKSINGVGRLPGAVAGAEKRLAQHGDAEKAIHAVVESHVRYAGAQGFLTNLGGLATMTFTVPANITGLALVECHMVAEIVYLRGYDLDSPAVRSAILVSLLGEEEVLALIRKKQLPGTPMEIATASVHDTDLTRGVANEVAAALIGRAAGKRAAGVVARRVPVVGGVVGAGADGYATWKIGRYVGREFLPRKRR